MGVGHSGHGVDLEVLVGSTRGYSLDGTPVGEGGLGIVEPFVSQSLHVVGIEVGNSLGDLRSGDSASGLDHLLSDLGVNLVVRLEVHHLVVEVVAASDDLNVVHEVSVDGGQADTTVVHLTGEDFVTHEVVSENTAVGVGEEVRVGDSHVDEVGEEGVLGVVLLLAVIEVLGVLVDSVASEDVLEESEGVVVFVVDRGGVVEDSNVGVVHLIISDKEERRGVDALIVGRVKSGGLLHGSKGLVALLDEGFVGNGTGSNNDHVVSEVVGSSVAIESFNSQVLDVITISVNGLSHHVVSVRVVMSQLKSVGLQLFEVVLVISSKLLFASLELSSVEVGVRVNVSEDVDSITDITLEASNRVGAPFSVSRSTLSGSHLFNLSAEINLGASRGSASEHHAEGVGSSGGLDSVLTRSSTDVDTDSCCLGSVGLGNDSNSIRQSSALEGTIVFE